MRVDVRNVLYKHVVKAASQPQLRPIRLCNFSSASTKNNHTYDESPRRLHDSPPPSVRDVAILGGGLTGLATAFWLTRQIPNANIIIYEKSHRLGGWVDSEIVPVGNDKILFEWGPRTVRCAFDGAPLSMIDMISELNLLDDIIAVSKDSPASLNRYVYYPDHLVRMPAGSPSVSGMLRLLHSIWTEPIYNGVVTGLRRELSAPVREPELKDESVGDFVSRRFGNHVADNLVSSLYHGVYAGDIYSLSARTLQPLWWHLETRDPDWGGVLQGSMFLKLQNYEIRQTKTIRDAQLRSMDPFSEAPLDLSLFKKTSVYTFVRGIGEIIEALEKDLRQNVNVHISKFTTAKEVSFNRDLKKVSVRVAKGRHTETSNYDYVVSSLGPSVMKDFFSKSAEAVGSTLDPRLIPACEHSNASVNVMVINLYYSNPDLIPPSIRGFGYLIPRSIPVEENPERALGVIFSSETSGRAGSLVRPSHRRKEDGKFTSAADPEKGSDTADFNSQDTAPGTKLTVIIGGHWWNGWPSSDLPSEEQGIEMAKSLLKRHLNIDESPLVAKARLNRNCIPQYPVGYSQDMATIHDALQSMYQGRLKVAGPWWQGGVGVNDCVAAARARSWEIRHQADHHTGLNDIVNLSWTLMHTETGAAAVESTR